MCMRLFTFVAGSLSTLVALAVVSAAELVFRTDGGDEKAPWFQLVPGEFPPAGSAHAISGELISVDHVNRKGVLRRDRAGDQRTDDYDQPLPFELLSYGSVAYHGAPAELRDIPIGTHLHGQFYLEDRAGKQVFGKVLRLEDDFSDSQGNHRQWRVDHFDRDKRTLSLIGLGPEGQLDPKPTLFRIQPATRIWRGRGLGSWDDLAAGQEVLVNLTVCTMKGPGRCLDVWLDDESRATATALQKETHRLFVREHGLAARVDEVDNQARIVTMTIFAGFDPELKNDFHVKEGVAIAVAEETLRTHDQHNDASRGPIVELLEGPPGPGDSGWRMRVRVNELLEGHRPKRFVRVFATSWPVEELPREESAYDG